jgi:hypothetical protein
MILKNAFFVILLSSWTLFSQAQNYHVVSPTEKLSVNIVISETTDFIRSWLSTPSKIKPYIKGVHDVIPEQTVYAAFLVAGFKPDKDGKYNFIVHWKLYNPDGSIMFDQKNYAKGSGNVPEKPSFIMADPALDLTLENTDVAGTYKLVATVEDLVVNMKASGEYKIRLIKK